MNIGELRKQLDDWESKWTKEDVKYLGEFESQAVLTDHYSGPPRECKTYQGIGPAKLYPYWELGLCIVPDEDERK